MEIFPDLNVFLGFFYQLPIKIGCKKQGVYSIVTGESASDSEGTATRILCLFKIWRLQLLGEKFLPYSFLFFLISNESFLDVSTDSTFPQLLELHPLFHLLFLLSDKSCHFTRFGKDVDWELEDQTETYDWIN